MAAEAEEALRRARRAERDAAAEVASLREESEALAQRVERQRRDEDASKRKREVETVVEQLGLAEREVLQQTSRSASTMRGLEQALAELARSVRSGDAPNPKAGPESATKSGLLASGDLASGDENAIPPVGADASDDGFFVLSQPPSRRYAPWFPETTASRETAPAASRDEATVSNAPVVLPRLGGPPSSPTRRSRRMPRRRRRARSGSRGSRRASGTARDTRDGARRGERPSRRRAESAARAAAAARASARAVARASRGDQGGAGARASLEKLRASQSGDRPDWEVRLELIEAENERTRLRLERARLGRSAGEAAALEEPKPREASPPQPWR